MLTWDTDKVFELLGGTPGVVALCAQTAPDVPPPAAGTVAVWKHRKRIAAEWVPVIVYGVFAGGYLPTAEIHQLFNEINPVSPPAAPAPSLEDFGL